MNVVDEADVEEILQAWRAQNALSVPRCTLAWHGGTMVQEIGRVAKAALAAHDGDVTATARALNISRTTLYKYLAAVH